MTEKTITIEMLEEAALDQPELLSEMAFRWLAQIARNRVSVLLHEMFQQLDDAVFNRAEQIRTEGDNPWADGLRNLRASKTEVVNCFREQLMTDFATLEEVGDLLAPAQVDPEQPDTEPRPIMPLNRESMRALNDAQLKAETECFRALNELNQHLGELKATDPVALAQNPLAPGSLCRGFQYAVNLLDVAPEVELAICEMFDRYVISQIRFALDHVNAQLRDIARLKEQIGAGGPKKINQLFATVRGLLASKRARDDTDEPAPTPEPEPELEPEPEPEPAPPPRAKFEPPDLGSGSEEEPAAEPEAEPVVEASAEPGAGEETEVEPDLEPLVDDEFTLEPVISSEESGTEPEEDDEAWLLSQIEGTDDAEEEGEALEGAGADDDLDVDALFQDAIDQVPAPVYELQPLPALAEGETRIIQTQDILAVLDEMQADPDWADPDPFSLLPDPDPVSFGTELRDRLKARREEYAAAEYSEEDEGTIDLVELVFDFVLHDHNLPEPLQKMLARLQVPYLRVALLDWQLFALSEHPARQLLDELARASQGWTEAADENREVYRRIEMITGQILENHHGDQTQFSHLLDGFSRFMRHFEQRAGDAERRSLEAMRERERLAALRKATEAIRERLPEDARLPELIDELLRRTLPELLVLYWLDFGGESDQWRSALNLVDDLVESGRERSSEEEVLALEALLPQLLHQLHEGMTLLAIDDFLKERIFDKLTHLYRRQVGKERAATLKIPVDPSVPPEPKETVAEPAQATTEDEEGDLGFDEAVELILGIDPKESVEPVTADSLHEALAGSWFEFSYEGQSAMRAKMSWSKPVGSKYLFVDQNGSEVAEKTLNELAAEIQSGHATMLESIPLFERALSAIAERLLSEQKASN